MSLVSHSENVKSHPTFGWERGSARFDVSYAVFVSANFLRAQRNPGSSSISSCQIAPGKFEIVASICLQPRNPNCVAGKRGQRYFDKIKGHISGREQSDYTSLPICSAASAGNSDTLK